MDANIGGTVADDDAIVYTIASNQVNAIRFLSPTRTLIIGTAGGEFAVYGGGDYDAITPTNIIIKKQIDLQFILKTHHPKDNVIQPSLYNHHIVMLFLLILHPY